MQEHATATLDDSNHDVVTQWRTQLDKREGKCGMFSLKAGAVTRENSFP
ncbi:hypothetical protein O3301_23570 [Janthinobacterium sp. SUN211]|uniref:Uncharacterized protein n=1 Tax=Janthinobacterium kumbetense TaxID=2950280 RepID=A0ABT0WY63_9BURK|nr:hypothetical protein [Janthinobacterium kumbetense]MDN2680569.1 hypothetical protein [Janthinobacterium sp. SUN033]MDO8051450.1 hypothetical protein [Janthinobacterium sp. SUN211]